MIRNKGGLAGAIRERCGNRVQKECDDYLNKRKMEMFVSEVSIFFFFDKYFFTKNFSL